MPGREEVHLGLANASCSAVWELAIWALLRTPGVVQLWG